MENKTNIAELLKDCPKDMELDCTVWDNCALETVFEGCLYPIQIQTPEGLINLTKYGSMSLNTHSKCVIFPKGKTTWEEFVPPCKFKVGDKIKYKNGRYKNGVKEGIILSITDDTYDVAVTNDMGIFIPIADEYNWELVPDKFDITTLVPFESRVLVRDFNDEEWCPAIWGVYGYGKEYPHIVVSGNKFIQCIPYEDNQHLLGTTNDCNEYYKTW